MSTLSVPNNFTASTTILSAEVNANFAAIVAWAAGGIGADNLDDLANTVTWAITTNVNGISSTNSGTEGSASFTHSGVLAAGKSALKVSSAAAQTDGDALAHFSQTNASSSIPTLLVKQAGTGRNISATDSDDAEVFGVNSGGFFGRHPFASKSADYTTVATDEVILVDASGAARTITLIAAASVAGRVLRIKKIDSSTNAVTIDGNSDETIDGAATYKLVHQYHHIEIISDGSNWHILDQHLGNVGVLKLTDTPGMGAVNTAILRFTNTESNTLVGVTYADSANDGMSVTVDVPGLYWISPIVGSSGGAIVHGISKNSNQLTTSIAGITAAHQLSRVSTAAANAYMAAPVVARLAAGDVLRAHSLAGISPVAGVQFIMTRVG